MKKPATLPTPERVKLLALLARQSSKAELAEEIEVAHDFLDQLGVPQTGSKSVVLDVPSRLKALAALSGKSLY